MHKKKEGNREDAMGERKRKEVILIQCVQKQYKTKLTQTEKNFVTQKGSKKV